MPLAFRSLGTASVPAVTRSGHATKLAAIPVACRPAGQPGQAVRRRYARAVAVPAIKPIPRAIAVTPHGTRRRGRAVPPNPPYFDRADGTAPRATQGGKA